VVEVREAEWLAIGLVVGLLIGIPLGWILFQIFRRTIIEVPYPASVIFDRDEQGRVTAIHYVPGAGRAG
jgi:hypothetical protein